MDNNIYYLVGPVITFSAGFYFYYKRQKFVKGGHKVEGEVIDMEKSGIEKFPVIRFKTSSNETITQKYKVSQGGKMRIGQRVQLYYNPDKPSDFMIDNVSEKWAPLLLITISIMFTILYFVFLANKK